MSRVFVTSDLHFGHSNLCEGLRGMTAEESDALIIENWNKVITKHDKVFILGDLAMDKCHLLKIGKLKGKKVLIGGNHDEPDICKLMGDLGIQTVGCQSYKGYVLTHIPIHPKELMFWKGNIHGHVHKSGKMDGLGNYSGVDLQGDMRYFNANVEFNNYMPVLFQDIERKIESISVNDKLAGLQKHMKYIQEEIYFYNVFKEYCLLFKEEDLRKAIVNGDIELLHKLGVPIDQIRFEYVESHEGNLPKSVKDLIEFEGFGLQLRSGSF